MDQELKRKLCAKDKWLRAIFMVIFGIIFAIITWGTLIVGLIALFQFIWVLFKDQPNKPLATFSDGFSQYLYQIAMFLTFVSDEKPFPFSSWPSTKGN